ncbi:MAG TPA: hypothetical protein VEA38_00325 [Terriglobales bacterium]|nr:hypothetical protein [Terriglobales bacterium]
MATFWVNLIGSVLSALIIMVWPAAAQPPSADDQLRECRVYASAAVTARTRQELEAAAAIAARDKEIERLRAELAAAKGGDKK